MATGKAAVRVPRKRGFWRRVFRFAALLILGFYTCVALSLAALRRFDPPFTAVHVERRVESWLHGGSYIKRYWPVPLDAISRPFQHAVIAAEDSRFYQHHGFDWEEIGNALDDEREGARVRGASTITQQLVKNLFLGTWRSPVRKGVEFTIVPLAEVILGKRRILELYLNVVEWGRGIYGAEAAAQLDYGVPAARITRDQGARLAAVLPAPLRRKPGRMNDYSARILNRMSKMGW